MKSIKTLNTRLFTAAILLFTHTAIATQSDIDAIEQAFYSNKIGQLREISNSTQGYEHFLASYRLALKYSFTQDEKKAKQTLDKLIQEMESHFKSHPKDEESLALLANIYGYSIGLNPFMGMTYGPKSHNRIDAALSIDKENPRVLMFKGILDYNTPAMFGGSKESAKTAFTLALDAFSRDHNSGKHWGFSETHVWLGLTYLELGDKQMARYYWEKALAVNPENDWASTLLDTNP
ncbi:tetratricopeptide repeat protein [Teredinibacter haidensis]|uniref:tetratricopeptide repeat protein n=1 Tax=Teredinibacter haidensis TaxID=2731755 RepID=UPI0009489B0E|nr:tetratricopeptide repeat protein [Teredinibacter haidensis]